MLVLCLMLCSVSFWIRRCVLVLWSVEEWPVEEVWPGEEWPVEEVWPVEEWPVEVVCLVDSGLVESGMVDSGLVERGLVRNGLLTLALLTLVAKRSYPGGADNNGQLMSSRPLAKHLLCAFFYHMFGFNFRKNLSA